ncbi:MAG: hypothetical protein KAT12_00005, partial [Gammaproteobacteria bacterium]|nr:hypothetical protein [Gammaproteobacteria bacterium]
LRFRICIIICLAVVLISAAVLFSVLRAVLPYATGYKNEIQQEISQQIGLPVEVESIDAAIHWFSPRLKLIGVSVFDKKNKVPLFNFKEAFVELDVIASIMYREIIVADVGLTGADISIEKLSATEWLVQGIKFTSEGSSELPAQFLYMLQNSDFLLHDSNIFYQDHTGSKLELGLLDINMDVQNNFNNHKIKFSMHLPEAFGKSLVVVADLQGDLESLDGEIYIEAQKVKVKQWNKKFNLLKQYEVDAVLDVNLWGTLDDNKIKELVAQLTSRDLSVINNETSRYWSTKFLTSDIRYLREGDHWNLAISDFYFGTESAPSWGRPVTVLTSDDDESFYLSADFLRLADLNEVMDVLLTAELKEKVKKFSEYVNTYRLSADVYNLSLRLPKDMSEANLADKLYLETSISNFSMRDEDNGIRLSGIDASVRYDEKQAVVGLQSKDAVVELKGLMRGPVSADILQGELMLQNIDENWQLTTSSLQLKNSHVNTFSRLDMRLSAEDEIFVDAQTDFYDGYGKYVTRYLPIGIMTPALIGWLDDAVVDGFVPEGTFILHGKLSDFPYHKHEGVFQVLFSPQNVNMKFLEGWPLLNATSGTLKFNNLSLVLSDAKAKTKGVALFNGYAEFLDLSNPHLTVRVDAHGKNVDTQSYVWDSPLDDILGDSMRLFQFQGNSDLSLALEIPLDKDEIDVTVDGHLTFIDTDIYYPALGYEISDINGVIDFTKESVFADSIIARINDRPISISALTEKKASGEQVVFHLDGVISADYLLQNYEWVPEDWLTGMSEWSVKFEVPYEPDQYLLHITASSYLEGIDIRVSDKVVKPGAERLGLVADVKVLDGQGLQVNARFTEDNAADKKSASVVDLFAVRNNGKAWNFDLKSKYIAGKGEFIEGLGKDTVMKLDLDEVDVHALFVSEEKKASEPLKPSDFPPLSWKVKKVLWKDWVLTDVNLETNWHEHGMLINRFLLKGPAMTFDARGTWLTSWNGAHETVMQGNINSDNCGDTLVGLGYQRSIDRCKYEGIFNSKWPAEPYSLSWSNMKGKTSFKMNDGELLEVDPGTGGRLLGMLNLFKLANRLAFDFDDVTREGFSFDTINGDFEFVNGDGSLKNFDLSATAADINMFGSIGMVKQDYGLLMRVKPHTDTLTFAGGALLGGVVVGAGLALIQKVFDLGIIGHNVYSITGSWDEPKVEKIVERVEEAADEDEF